MNQILFSKNSDNWRTPSIIYNWFMDDGYFDPCPLYSNFDGLKIHWKKKNFVNPPYSKIKDFVNKSIEEFVRGNDVILLIPARTDTKYFRKLVDFGVNIFFKTGRLHFNDSNSAPFPSCYIELTGKSTKCYWVDRILGE